MRIFRATTRAKLSILPAFILVLLVKYSSGLLPAFLYWKRRDYRTGGGGKNTKSGG